MKGFKTFTLFIVLFSAFILTGCGGGGGGGGTTPTPTAQTLSGTAAQGAPIANATVELKDSQGVTDNTTTDDNGKYSVTVTMTAPILLKVTTGDKT